MFGDTLKRLRELRPSVRALLYLYWIYAFAGSMVGVFVQIYLYQKFTSVSLNMVATMVFYTGIMLGFCIPGFFIARFRLNSKYGFATSFVVLAVSLVLLLSVSSEGSALFAMCLWGIGQGIYWLTINTFELTETKDAERDFYSSILNAGNQILGLLGPASATLLIWLSINWLHFGTFTLLFLVAPLIYLLGFLCFSRIRDYRPAPLALADVTHFITDRRNQYAQLFTAGTGFQQALGVTIPPLVLLLILGTPLHVGVYDTFFAIFSALCLIAAAQYRNSHNRLGIYAGTTAGLVLVIALLGYLLSIFGLVIYTLVEGILGPLNNVSSHVTDLASMEIGRKESDFYATMILRDFSLWAWRMVGGATFLLTLQLFSDERQLLSVGLYLLAGGLALTYVGAYFLVTNLSRSNS